jgi:Tfp pilus assembly protein PilX
MNNMLRWNQKQKGSVLFIALTFLVVITLMGLSGMQTATLQERMAGGERDYSIALQVAEMALRDAEHDLLGVDFNNQPIPGIVDGTGCVPGAIGRACFERSKPNISAPSRPVQSIAGYGANNTLWKVNCPWGQCYISPNAGAPKPNFQPIWTDPNLWVTDARSPSVDDTVPSSVIYGSFTGAKPLSVPTQPRYILESLNYTGSSSALVGGSVLNFRITARATGFSSQTIVWLQEVIQCSSTSCQIGS